MASHCCCNLSVDKSMLPKRPIVNYPNQSMPLIRDWNDKIIINPVKKHLKPYHLCTEPNTVDMTGITGDFPTSTYVPMPIDNEGPVEIVGALIELDGDLTQQMNITMEIFDDYNRRLLMNRQLPVDMVCGFAQQPFLFSVPLLLDPEVHGKAIHVRFQKVGATGAGHNVRFTLYGRRMYHYEPPDAVMEAWDHYCRRTAWTEPYILTTDSMIRTFTGNVQGAPVATTTTEQDMRVPDDADFEIFDVMVVAIDPRETGTFEGDNFDITLREKSKQRPWMNLQVRQRLLGGSGRFRFKLPEPIYLERNHQIQVEVTNIDAGIDYFWIAFNGRKIYHTDQVKG